MEVEVKTHFNEEEDQDPGSNPPTATSLKTQTQTHDKNEQEEQEDDAIEEEGEDEEEEEEDESRAVVSFEGQMDPLDFVKGDTCTDVQLYQQFEKLEYEALALRNNKAPALHDSNNHHGEGSSKKARLEEYAGATAEEILEAMTYGAPRRRSKKLKKRGRRKGSRNKLSPEVTKKLGDANLHYAHGRYEDASSLLIEVVRLAPNIPDPYHTLGLVYNSMGDKKKATDCYMIAAYLGPKESPLWKLLVSWSIEQGNIGQAWYCLSKAISADPADVSLRYHLASLNMDIGNYSKAAELYDQIVQICPDKIEALETATKLHKQCGQFERSISILENYLKQHPPDADTTVVDMLASSCMERHDYSKAVRHIADAENVWGSGKQFPEHLTIKKGICHLHLDDMEKAENCFSLLQTENSERQVELIRAVGNAFMELQHYEAALKYYLMLEGRASNNGLDSLRIAHCYSAVKETATAIQFFYKALQAHEDDIDARLTLASLLLEANREDEAVALLSPPFNPGLSSDTDVDRPEPWWLNVKVKLKLSQVYRTKGMPEAFVEVIFPVVYESLKIYSMHQKAKRKRLTRSELKERVKVLGDHQTDSVFGKFKRPASKNDKLKANRARKKLEKKASSKEEKISASMAGGCDWESDDSEYEIPQQPLKEPPLPDLFEDDEHYNLISDLCRALTSLRRYSEALELVTLTLKISYKTLPAEKKEKFRSLGAQIATYITDPSDGFDYVRYIVQQRPQSIAAWNCYYRLVLRLENRLSKHNKFLHHMRVEQKDLVPPMIISGNQFTMISQHQVAAREYLEAYKQMPESPLVNLCAGAALVNLALGHRLQNKQQCVAQGLAFLCNNLHLCGNSQEALYNFARACHHVGLVSLAASYYEKVLAIRQEDLPLPELIKMNKDHTKTLKPGYCDLRREAAYNLHLIYKSSGAVDLARQVLRDYCTL